VLRPADIEEKFFGLVDGLLPAGRAEEIVQAVWSMDKLASVTELTGLLQP
jgi:hypothetical protein